MAAWNGTSHRLTFTGAAAVVRLGYQKAATLGAWRVDGDGLSAELVAVDGFRITQSPLTLEIPNRDGIPTIRGLEGVTVSGKQLFGRVVRQAVR